MPGDGIRGRVRFMYLFVFFDLPVKSKSQRRAAARFRQFLINDGYDMIQYSVYSRLCREQDAVDKHLKRLQGQLPQEGSIRALQVTDKQYGRMKILVGTQNSHEEAGVDQLVLL